MQQLMQLCARPWVRGDKQTEHAGCTELCVENITIVAAVVVDGRMPEPYCQESLLSMMANNGSCHPQKGTVQAMSLFQVLHTHVDLCMPVRC
jgi:hypothetical protein